MKARFLTCDVFTDRRFGGNQLAVFPDAREIAPELMAPIAKEFNYSETTFVLPPDDPSHTAKVRIFTPGGELQFAGHPTVGTAHVLATIGAVKLTGDETQIVFEEGVGPVPVTIRSQTGQTGIRAAVRCATATKSARRRRRRNARRGAFAVSEGYSCTGTCSGKTCPAEHLSCSFRCATATPSRASRVKLDLFEAALSELCHD